MSNPPANTNDQSSTSNDTTTNNNAATGYPPPVPDTSPEGHYQPCGWTRDEQSLLEELNTKYASDEIVKRYAKIVLQMPGKTMLDVAHRLIWTKVKAAGKQVIPSSPATDSSNSSYSVSCVSYEEIGGEAGQLLRDNEGSRRR